MDFSCPHCRLAGHIDDAKVPEQGLYATCPKCRQRFLVKKPPVLEKLRVPADGGPVRRWPGERAPDRRSARPAASTGGSDDLGAFIGKNSDRHLKKCASFNRGIIVVGVAVLVVLGYAAWNSAISSGLASRYHLAKSPYKGGQFIYDLAHVLPEQDLPRFEQYMRLIMEESGIDIRFFFVNGTGDATIEQFAVDLMEKLRIGGRTGDQRGLLLLYDTASRRLKVEVGYGLEEYFPDAFVSYLVNRHARMFFEAGNKSLGLRLLLRLLQHRIREAVLGNAFDPRILNELATGNLSGGAGVSATMHEGGMRPLPPSSQLSEAARSLFVAQDSPQETYNLYLKWLSQPVYDPHVGIFTEKSQQYLSGLHMSAAYFDFILLSEYGKEYRVTERNGLAILYFTSTPLVSPHFFVKENGRWQMDMTAEVQNTREIVGGIYNWTYIGKDDSYTQAFADQLTYIRGYARFREGDNRALTVSRNR